jgi:hypothetical protein
VRHGILIRASILADFSCLQIVNDGGGNVVDGFTNGGFVRSGFDPQAQKFYEHWISGTKKKPLIFVVVPFKAH